MNNMMNFSQSQQLPGKQFLFAFFLLNVDYFVLNPGQSKLLIMNQKPIALVFSFS